METSFLFLCQTSYCPDLKAKEQIPFDLQLSKGTQKTLKLTFKGCEKFAIHLFQNSWHCMIAASSVSFILI